MFKNFVTEILHVTKKLKAKEMNVEKSSMHDLDVNRLDVKDTANVKKLDVGTIVDNGSVYGERDEIKSLTTDQLKNINDAGKIHKPARVDHTHKIPDAIKNPHKLVIKNNADKTISDYDGSSKKEIKLTYEMVGAAKKNHASTSTEFGCGNSSDYGHVKLSDFIDLTSDASKGIGATPKAVGLVNAKFDDYLPLVGGTMNGSIITPSNAIGLIIGGHVEIKDSNEIEGMIMSSENSSLTRVGIGTDNSTVLESNDGDGTLYLKNFIANLQTNQIYGDFSPISKRAIVDHIIEKVIVSSESWVPERSGNYRLYIVGGGGKGGDGKILKLNIRDGGLRTDGDYDGSSSSHYDIDYVGNGFALPGYGGGGGGVCVVDIYVNPVELPYKIVEELVKDSDDADDDGYTIETLSPTKRLATFTFSGKQITVTGLDSISGGQYREYDDSGIRVYGGSDATTGTLTRSSYSTSSGTSYNYSWYTDNSNGTYTKGTKYVECISKIQEETGSNVAGLAPDTKPSNTNDLFGEIREWNTYRNMQGISNGDGTYYIRSGSVWKKYDSSGIYMGGYDLNNTKMAMYDTGCETSSELKEFLDGQTISSYLNEQIADIPALRTISGKWVEFMYDQSKFSSQFVKVTYGICGVGGYAEGYIDKGISSDYYGGSGDDAATVNESATTDGSNCIATNQPNRANGYGGGIPGGNKYIGIVGGGAAAGGVKYLKPAGNYDGAIEYYDKDGVISGSGGSICIREFGGYYGINDTSITPSSSNGGAGNYGGGGGGGAAIICGSGAIKTGTQGAVTTGGAGGKPCVIIAYLGG